MNLMDMIEQREVTERAVPRSGETVRVHVKVREGDRSASRSSRASSSAAPRRIARDLHGPQGLVRPGRRAISRSTRRSSTDRRRAQREGRRSSSIPARSQGQGRAHEGTEAHRHELAFTGDASLVRVRAFRTMRTPSGARATRVSPASMKWGAAASPVPSWPARCARSRKYVPRIPIPRPSPRRARAPVRAHRQGGRRLVGVGRRARGDRSAQHPYASLAAMTRAVLGLAPQPTSCSSTVQDSRHPEAQRAVSTATRGARPSPPPRSRQVTRDRLMRQLHEQYPVYGLTRHKGYATKEHLDAVAAHGYSAIHRKSFKVHGAVVGTSDGVGLVDGGGVGSVTAVKDVRPEAAPTYPPRGSSDAL